MQRVATAMLLLHNDVVARIEFLVTKAQVATEVVDVDLAARVQLGAVFLRGLLAMQFRLLFLEGKCGYMAW